MELSLPVLTTYVCCGLDSNTQPSACEVNALTHCATVAVMNWWENSNLDLRHLGFFIFWQLYPIIFFLDCASLRIALIVSGGINGTYQISWSRLIRTNRQIGAVDFQTDSRLAFIHSFLTLQSKSQQREYFQIIPTKNVQNEYTVLTCVDLYLSSFKSLLNVIVEQKACSQLFTQYHDYASLMLHLLG